MKKITGIILSGIVLFSFIGSAPAFSAKIATQDSLTLVALYHSTDGANWTNNTNWLSGKVPDWYGISVSEGYVSHIDLNLNNLIGTIPNEIGSLAHLESLDLHANQLTGGIPEAIGSLADLTFLSLWGNQLTGEIPSAVGALTKLTRLLIGSNQFTGEIPAELCDLTNLTNLGLNGCQFTGRIPTEIGNLDQLTTLSLNGNQLSGSIPASIGQLTRLTTLSLQSNQLDGPIPAGIGNLTQLITLYGADNQLTGSIPADIGKLTQLTLLNFRENLLTGEIPATIGNLTQLTSLDLSVNQLEGTIPAGIGNLTQLTFLDLFANQLEGVIPAGIVNCINLQQLLLAYNLFTGLPDLSGISTLNRLDIMNNNFTFEDIEPNINIPGLTYLFQDSVGTEETRTVEPGSPLTLSVTVGGTQNQYQWMKDGLILTGATDKEYIIDVAILPDAGRYECRITSAMISELTLFSRPVHVVVDETFSIESDSLVLVAFYNSTNGPNWVNHANWLSGKVSDWFGITVTGGRVTGIKLAHNNLAGSIPPQIGNLTRLAYMNLSNNHLTGEIPAQIGTLYSLYSLLLGMNHFSGELPAEMKRLNQLTELYIHKNALTGLPDFTAMPSLMTLYVEGNQLTFEDLEPNIGIAQFVYSNQDSTGMEQDTSLEINDSMTLTVSVGGTANQYQWMRNGQEIPSATDPSYTITYTDTAILGIYSCEITSTIATDLTLYSRPVHVTDPTLTGIAQTTTSIPGSYALYQNYPNPFNPSTAIRFALPETSTVSLKLYDSLGREVLTLVDEKLQAGEHCVSFHAEGLPSGIYFYSMKAGHFQKKMRFVLIK